MSSKHCQIIYSIQTKLQKSRFYGNQMILCCMYFFNFGECVDEENQTATIKDKIWKILALNIIIFLKGDCSPVLLNYQVDNLVPEVEYLVNKYEYLPATIGGDSTQRISELKHPPKIGLSSLFSFPGIQNFSNLMNLMKHNVVIEAGRQ